MNGTTTALVNAIEIDCSCRSTEEMVIHKNEIQATDVICSRGNGVLNHPGNVLYANLIRERKPAYQSISVAKKKRVFINDVLRIIKSSDPPGRFLKLSGKSKKGEDLYKAASETEAAKKIAQALREKPKKHHATNKRKNPSGENLSPTSEDPNTSLLLDSQGEKLPPPTVPLDALAMPPLDDRSKKSRRAVEGIKRRRTSLYEKLEGRGFEDVTSTYSSPAVVSRNSSDEDGNGTEHGIGELNCFEWSANSRNSFDEDGSGTEHGIGELNCFEWSANTDEKVAVDTVAPDDVMTGQNDYIPQKDQNCSTCNASDQASCGTTSSCFFRRSSSWGDIFREEELSEEVRSFSDLLEDFESI